MYKTEDVIQAAHTIRPHLNGLLSTEAKKVDYQLGELLSLANVGEDVKIEIFDLLGEHEQTRVWMQKVLENKKIPSREKSYSPLNLGKLNTQIAVQVYICPECNYKWVRHRFGEKVPQCPRHHIDLMREMAW